MFDLSFDAIHQSWWWPFVFAAVMITAAMLAAMLLHRLLYRILNRIWRQGSGFMYLMLKRTRRSSRWLFGLLGVYIATELLDFGTEWNARTPHLLYPLMILTMGWVMVGVARAVGDWSDQHFAWDKTADNMAARSISTQIRGLLRFVIAIIVVLTGMGIIMSIPSLRSLGVSLFASAGVAGLAVGIAARPALENIIAGIQLALTQPIRIDDVVIVENEWGRVETIDSTYVVVRIWDERRMIVPLTYFIQHPFQNWTHKLTHLLGTVFLYLDYSVPMEPLRREMTTLLESNPLWDGQVNVIQVTDVKENTIELRLLMSSGNSSDLFDLRCFIRERMIGYIQAKYPYSLPRVRNEISRNEQPKRPIAQSHADASRSTLNQPSAENMNEMPSALPEPARRQG